MNATNSNLPKAPATVRPFARVTACEVAQGQPEEGLFLTIFTDPDRPEPEVGALS